MNKRKRVLIVDDCVDTRIVFTHLLELFDAEVVTASDGKMGLKSVISATQEGRAFDMILMDIRMPEVNGVDAAKLIRNEGFSGLIAACTASSSGEGRRESRVAGIDVYFDKRAVNKELIAALLHRCSSSRRNPA